MDPEVQSALACSCYWLLNFITVKWYDVAPELLGCLGPIVRDLLPGRTLSAFYPPPIAGQSANGSPFISFHRPVPSPLFEIFHLGAVLRESQSELDRWVGDIRAAAEEVGKAREAYRRTYLASRVVRTAVCIKLFAAFTTSQASIMEAEFLFWERQETWDRVVHLLRGDSFFKNNFPFEQEDFYPPEMDWVFMGLPQHLRLRNAEF